jgi:hypothetical protein
MRRCLIVLAFLLTTLAGPATATAGTACATSAAATYRHTFTGPAGAITVAAVVPLCAGQSQTFSLVSYTVTAGAQFVYDTDHATVDAKHRTVELDVAVPRCATQVDAVFGSGVLTEVAGTSAGYGNAKLGSASGTGHRSSGRLAWYGGGTPACAPRPSVTFSSACDGGFTATLANRAGATVTAVFLVDGQTHRVAPGTRTTVVGEAGGSLTVRDNTFQTNTGTWSMPAVCEQPTLTPTTVPAAPIPAVTPTSATPTSSSAVVTSAPPRRSATPSTSGTTAAADGGTTFQPATPAAADTAESSADLAVAGSSSGSVALIALGVLLIGGGVVILGRQLHRARHAD